MVYFPIEKEYMENIKRNETKLRERFNIEISFDADGADITGSAESCGIVMDATLSMIKKARKAKLRRKRWFQSQRPRKKR